MKKNILLIEDDPTIQRLMQTVLEPAYRVHVGSTIDECFSLLRNISADLILLDITLTGGESGLELMSHLRTHPEFHAIPVVAVTAHAMPGDVEEGLKAGFAAYLTKPFHIPELRGTIARLLERAPEYPSASPG